MQTWPRNISKEIENNANFNGAQCHYNSHLGLQNIRIIVLHQCNAPPHTIIEFMSLQAFYVIIRKKRRTRPYIYDFVFSLIIKDHVVFNVYLSRDYVCLFNEKRLYMIVFQWETINNVVYGVCNITYILYYKVRCVHFEISIQSAFIYLMLHFCGLHKL